MIGVLASSGCSVFRGTEVSPELPPDRGSPGESSAPLENALAYFQRLHNLSGSDLRREREAAQQAFAASASELNRVRLALVLSMPAAPFKDERRALELLEPMTRGSNGSYTPLRRFALVIQSFVREQNKLAGDTQALKDKLDALKSLEKSLIERDRSAPGGPR